MKSVIAVGAGMAGIGVAGISLCGVMVGKVDYVWVELLAIVSSAFCIVGVGVLFVASVVATISGLASFFFSGRKPDND